MSDPERRIRVLTLLNHASDQGGAERFALALAERLPPDRFESWVCSTRWSIPEVERSLAQAQVSHLALRRRAKWDVHRLAPLASLLRRQRFDVLHAHMFGSNVWGSILGHLAGVPVIVAHEHNWSYSGGRVRMLLDRDLIGRLATRFVAVSEANRRRMIEQEGIPAEKVVVLPTAYIPHSQTPLMGLRAELGLDEQAQLIGVAATLRPEKALNVLIAALARVAARFPHAHLVIAGDGPCRAAWEEQARALGLAERVHWLGARRDVTAILREVDIGAMSSEWEGMPLFVFECMATDTALVATAVGGIPEIVSDGDTGLLVPPGDEEALAASLARLLQDGGLRRRLAAAASAHVAEYDIERVSARFVALYEELLGAGDRHALAV